MTEKAKRQDREEAHEDQERLSTEMSSELASELAPECGGQDHLDEADASEYEAAAESAETTTTASPRARRAPRASVDVSAAVDESECAQEPESVSTIPTDLDELEAQGFSAEEAQRLIDISIRLESSAEARASQAELKRLRFAQWLVEHGILNEFKA